MHLKSWHFNGGNQVADKHIGSWKSLKHCSDVFRVKFFFCLIFGIISPWIPVIFSKKDRIQTCHVYHEPHTACFISSIELPRIQVLQHGRVISTYIRSLWLRRACVIKAQVTFFLYYPYSTPRWARCGRTRPAQGRWGDSVVPCLTRKRVAVARWAMR